MPEAPQPFPPATVDAPWRPAAVIRHETADGAHFDLLLAAAAELSGGRGRVHPVARGEWRAGADGAVEVRWEGAGAARYRLDPAGTPAAMLRRIAR